MLLRVQGLAGVSRVARLVVTDLLDGGYIEERVRRADLFVDVDNVVFSSADESNFVTRSRRLEKYVPETKLYESRSGGEVRVTGFTFAPGNPRMARLYDKLAELEKVAGEGSEKHRTELANYRRAGWIGGGVWRLELQLRSSALREYGVDNLDQLQAACWSIWDHAFGSERPWLRLVLPGTATRIERRAVDPRWEPFQDNPWVDPEMPVDRVDGHLGGIAAEQLVGVVQSFLGTYNRLRPLPRDATFDDMIDRDFQSAAELAKSVTSKSTEAALKSRSSAEARYSRIRVDGRTELVREVEEILKKEGTLP